MSELGTITGITVWAQGDKRTAVAVTDGRGSLVFGSPEALTAARIALGSKELEIAAALETMAIELANRDVLCDSQRKEIAELKKWNEQLRARLRDSEQTDPQTPAAKRKWGDL